MAPRPGAHIGSPSGARDMPTNMPTNLPICCRPPVDQGCLPSPLYPRWSTHRGAWSAPGGRQLEVGASAAAAVAAMNRHQRRAAAAKARRRTGYLDRGWLLRSGGGLPRQRVPRARLPDLLRRALPVLPDNPPPPAVSTSSRRSASTARRRRSRCSETGPAGRRQQRRGD
jgi:hypothetical protein